MGPMCVSLIQQYLDNTNSSLADPFKHKYQPLKSNVKWDEVLSKWREEQLARSLVYQHMKTVSPTLAGEFKAKFQPQETKFQSPEALSEWKEEQLARSLVYKHLNSVDPSFAVEFQSKGFVESLPESPIGLAQKTISDVANKKESCHSVKDDKKQKQNNYRVKVKRFTTEEILRIERAIAMKENVGAIAKEMGRSYDTVHKRFMRDQQSGGMKKGKWSIQEMERVRRAATNKEDHKVVARELGRAPLDVKRNMNFIRNDPDRGNRAQRKFSLQEDLLILDEVILRLDVSKLSCVGDLPPTSSTKLAKDMGRTKDVLPTRWNRYILPCLLQHYAGTTGFRVERMLTRLVADKFTDAMGIDWDEIVGQHKEFLGHTRTSLSKTFQYISNNAKRYKGAESLQEVAEYAADVYQPGKERKEPAAKTAHREAVIAHFKKRINELGINVML